jgi:hypothetical protein
VTLSKQTLDSSSARVAVADLRMKGSWKNKSGGWFDSPLVGTTNTKPLFRTLVRAEPAHGLEGGHTPGVATEVPKDRLLRCAIGRSHLSGREQAICEKTACCFAQVREHDKVYTRILLAGTGGAGVKVAPSSLQRVL